MVFQKQTVNWFFHLQSEERAGKLQAEMAVEEQCGMEFCRFLKEELQEPKPPSQQKSATGRKASIERGKISKDSN
ncbi:hypothetical protein SLE2022_066930 [Rubroshorea leprosula]